MSFEQLYKLVVKNFDRIKDKKQTTTTLRCFYEMSLLKREKLKLGKILFEIKEHMDGEIVLYESLEMVFCRQDNTDENELKIENRLKEYD